MEGLIGRTCSLKISPVVSICGLFKTIPYFLVGTVEVSRKNEHFWTLTPLHEKRTETKVFVVYTAYRALLVATHKWRTHSALSTTHLGG